MDWARLRERARRGTHVVSPVPVPAVTKEEEDVCRLCVALVCVCVCVCVLAFGAGGELKVNREDCIRVGHVITSGHVAR